MAENIYSTVVTKQYLIVIANTKSKIPHPLFNYLEVSNQVTGVALTTLATPLTSHPAETLKLCCTLAKMGMRTDVTAVVKYWNQGTHPTWTTLREDCRVVCQILANHMASAPAIWTQILGLHPPSSCTCLDYLYKLDYRFVVLSMSLPRQKG